MSAPLMQWFAAPTAGEAPDLPPDLMSAKHARALRNFLVHHPGRIVPRGNIGGPTATIDTGALVDTTNGGAVTAVVTFDDLLEMSYRAPAATPLVDPWRVPINRPATAPELAQPSLGATAGRAVDLRTGIITSISTAATTSVASGSVARQDNASYGVTWGDSAAIPTGVAQLNCIRKADFVSNAVVLFNGPRFVQAVFSHYGRIWAAAARRPAGADYDTSQVFYTIPGGTTAYTDVASDWTDPVTGELNRISIGAANDGDFVVGFGRAAGHLLIFKRNSVWIMYGTAPSNFVLRQLRAVSGCVDLRSIVVGDNGTYFASQLGYELFDGEDFSLVSEPISDTYLAVSNAGVAASTVNHAYIRGSVLPNGYLYLSMGTDSHVASATDGTTLGWLLHMESGAWVELRTALNSLGLGADGKLNRMAMSRSHVLAIGASRWAKADSLTYGASTTTGVVDRDSSTSFAVSLLWTTRLDDLSGGRWATSTLHRATADYRQRYTTTDPPALDPWGTLLATDGFGASLMPSQNLPGYSTPAPLRARPTFTPKHESNRGDLSFTLQSSVGSASTKRIAELNVYGLGVAYIRGRERVVA